MEKHPKIVQHLSHEMQRSILPAPTTLRSIIYNNILQLKLKQARPSKEQAHAIVYELLCWVLTLNRWFVPYIEAVVIISICYEEWLDLCMYSFIAFYHYKHRVIWFAYSVSLLQPNHPSRSDDDTSIGSGFLKQYWRLLLLAARRKCSRK